MRNVDYILAVSIIVNIILGAWIFSLVNIDSQIPEENLKSQGRVEMLEKQRDKLAAEKDSLTVLKDSLNTQLGLKPKERVKIVKVYESKIDSVVGLPFESSVEFLARRLSEDKANR